MFSVHGILNVGNFLMVPLGQKEHLFIYLGVNNLRVFMY